MFWVGTSASSLETSSRLVLPSTTAETLSKAVVGESGEPNQFSVSHTIYPIDSESNERTYATLNAAFQKVAPRLALSYFFQNIGIAFSFHWSLFGGYASGTFPQIALCGPRIDIVYSFCCLCLERSGEYGYAAHDFTTKPRAMQARFCPLGESFKCEHPGWLIQTLPDRTDKRMRPCREH
jgi:hypothetical protein